MTINSVYQTVQFEVISLNDPELETDIARWGIEDLTQVVPEDSMSHLQHDNAFLILNKATNAIGVIDPVNLSLYFNEYHPSEGISGVKKTFMEKVIEQSKALEDNDDTEDFFRGVNAVTRIFYDAQHEKSSPYTEDAEVHDDAV